MTVDALQALSFAELGIKEAMANLSSINLTLSHSLTQSQETMLVISKQLQELQVQAKANTPTTERPGLEKTTRDTTFKCYCWTH